MADQLKITLADLCTCFRAIQMQCNDWFSRDIMLTFNLLSGLSSETILYKTFLGTDEVNMARTSVKQL